jgi:hypothetical protein
MQGLETERLKKKSYEYKLQVGEIWGSQGGEYQDGYVVVFAPFSLVYVDQRVRTTQQIKLHDIYSAFIGQDEVVVQWQFSMLHSMLDR